MNRPHFGLLSIPFFARRDDFVGQVVRCTLLVRPIVNRSARFAACRFVGQAILPAAAFQAAPGLARNLACGSRRLKAGGSQDWMPHMRRVSEPHE